MKNLLAVSILILVLTTSYLQEIGTALEEGEISSN
jgi:hypothetical protein